MARVKIKGLKRLNSRFGRQENSFKRHMHLAADAAGRIIKAEATELTPIDSGRLRAGVAAGFRVQGSRAILNPNVKYAVYVHEGTKRWPLSKPPRNKRTKRQFYKVAIEKKENEAKKAAELILEDFLRSIS